MPQSGIGLYDLLGHTLRNDRHADYVRWQSGRVVPHERVVVLLIDRVRCDFSQPKPCTRNYFSAEFVEVDAECVVQGATMDGARHSARLYEHNSGIRTFGMLSTALMQKGAPKPIAGIACERTFRRCDVLPMLSGNRRKDRFVEPRSHPAFEPIYVLGSRRPSVVRGKGAGDVRDRKRCIQRQKVVAGA